MYMIDLPLDASRLVRFAWGQGHGRSPDEDFGYTAHAWLTAVFGDKSPKPFRLMESRAGLRLLGYTSRPFESLSEQAHTFSKPQALAVCDWSAAAGKAMPTEWASGRRLGFEVRACPISRAEHERDIYLAAIDKAESAGQTVPMRADVYAQWLVQQLSRDGAVKVNANNVHMNGFRRFRGQRIAHGGGSAKHHSIERPDALFFGEFEVADPASFQRLLQRGIGRHRAFGFGMLLLRPPGAVT